MEDGSRDGVREEKEGRDITILPRLHLGRRLGRIGQLGHCDQVGGRYRLLREGRLSQEGDGKIVRCVHIGVRVTVIVGTWCFVDRRCRFAELEIC